MAENVFTQRFCDIVKKQVCTTSAELNFDKFTAPGTYEIYEDIGSGQNRVYFLTVDKSASGKCTTQTRTHCGKVEYRHYTTAGKWTAWAEVTGGGNLDGKEDKENKVNNINLDNIPDPNTEEYPNVFGVASAIIKNSQYLEEKIEQTKGFCITGKGEPTDATADKVGLLYYDEDSTPPAVYVCAKIDDESFAWLPVDVMGRDAWDYVTALYFDVTCDKGSIAQNYQRKWDKVTTISSSSTDEQYPSAKAAYNFTKDKANWQKVIEETITEDVNVFTKTLGNKYKELFVVMKIPSIASDTVTVPKSRVGLYAGDLYYKALYMEQSDNLSDMGYDTFLVYHIQSFGKYARAHRYLNTMDITNSSGTPRHHYAQTSSFAFSPFVDIGQTYFDKLTFQFVSTSRMFPVGTTYEIWGVKA